VQVLVSNGTGCEGEEVMTPWRRRRERHLAERARFRAARRLATEDVTVLGEQLSSLHVETLTDALDDLAVGDYSHALSRYEDAKQRLAAADDVADVQAVDVLVAEARFHRACVLARVAGEALPVRRDPCFFNPQHLPAVADVAWTPPQGTERTIPVCPACRQRLAHGDAPDVRTVRVGDRWVTWWTAGGSTVEVVRAQHDIVHGTYSTESLIEETRARAALDRLGNQGGVGH